MKSEEHQKNNTSNNQSCHHPQLKVVNKGETICASCGRTVYSNINANKG